jgi:hypothetical protein
MPADEGAELRDALKASRQTREAGEAHRGDSALERALLMTSAASIDTDDETVAAAVRMLGDADDGGTTRLEVRDQGMTHRRWFEVDAHGAVTWGER